MAKPATVTPKPSTTLRCDVESCGAAITFEGEVPSSWLVYHRKGSRRIEAAYCPRCAPEINPYFAEGG
jgi:hypothetical protein